MAISRKEFGYLFVIFDAPQMDNSAQTLEAVASEFVNSNPENSGSNPEKAEDVSIELRIIILRAAWIQFIDCEYFSRIITCTEFCTGSLFITKIHSYYLQHNMNWTSDYLTQCLFCHS